MSLSPEGLRIIFAGTPQFAAHHLDALISSPHQVVAVYTQPDRPAGRGKKLTPSPVKVLAQASQIPVFQPPTLKEADTQTIIASHQADVMVVVAYGLLLPKAVLDIPIHGCLNVHASLLPRWRGAAPIQRAILGDKDNTGDRQTGVTIMQMDVGLDTGDMLYTSECAIEADDTSASLHDKLMALGPPALLQTLELLRANKLQPIKQDDALATYAAKITKEEANIDWIAPAATIERNIRGYMPFPVAYTLLNDKRIKIHKAKLVERPSSGEKPGEILSLNEQGLLVACGKHALLLQQLQLPGKKPMSAMDIVNGYSDVFSVGNCFGQ